MWIVLGDFELAPVDEVRWKRCWGLNLHIRRKDHGRVQQSKHRGRWHESLFVCDNHKSEGGESEFEALDRCAVKEGE